MEMHPFFRVLDPYLIWFFRLTGNAALNFVIGTAVLAGIALVIGELSSFLISLISRRRLDQYAEEALKYKDLSIDALKAGNKEAYRAANKLGNEAFGLTFFMQFAVGAAFLWPICFALAWMQYRFLKLAFPIPFTGYSLGYIGVFILIYIPVYLLFKKVKGTLAYFPRTKGLPNGYASAVKHQ